MTMTTEQAEWFAGTFETLVANVGQAVLGKSHVIRLTFTAMLAEGHVLFEDAPGTGKTSLARALAATVQGSNNRIQFTPDLLPSDVTGVTIYDQKTQKFEFHKGPDLQQHRPRRRNQPRLAQDPVGPAGGHGGIARHRGRQPRTRPAARLW